MLYLECIGPLIFFRSLHSFDTRGAETEGEAFEMFELKDRNARTYTPEEGAEREAGQSHCFAICSRRAGTGHPRKKNRSFH